jgi:MFS family permease
MLFLPQLLLAVPAGVLADRADRRLVIIASCLTEAAGLGGFIALIALDVHAVWLCLAAVAFIGCAHTMGIPAQRSLLVNIVPRDQFVRTQAATSSVVELISIAGPALGGVLIAISTRAGFAAAAGAYVAATLAFVFLRRHAVEFERVPLARAASEGVRFIASNRVILGAISLDLFAVLFGGATALLPVFATKVLHVGPAGFGLLRAAPAAGAAVVAVYVARHSLRGNAGSLLLLCVAGFGAATIVFGLSRSFALSLVALVFTGAFDMVSVVIRSALVQLRTPDVMRGRVGAVENVFIGASNELGAFESGGVAALIGATASVVLGGAATLLVIALWAVLFPEIRSFQILEPETNPSS